MLLLTTSLLGFLSRDSKNKTWQDNTDDKDRKDKRHCDKINTCCKMISPLLDSKILLRCMFSASFKPMFLTLPVLDCIFTFT